MITYALERDADFLYSRNSEYIHAMKTGITPKRKDTCNNYKKGFIKNFRQNSHRRISWTVQIYIKYYKIVRTSDISKVRIVEWNIHIMHDYRSLKDEK